MNLESDFQSLCIVIACHNRKAKTVACLRALFASITESPLICSVVLVDDGSTDGTRQAVADEFPSVNILMGSGSLYWGGGMRLGFQHAMAGTSSFFLWLNDDVILESQALRVLFTTWRAKAKSSPNGVIVVGSTCDTNGSLLTYGGQMFRDQSFKKVAPKNISQCCDSMNGNIVMIPRNVADKVGNIDDNFIHALGDLDYGLRAKRLGVTIVSAPGFQGTCQRNTSKNTYKDTTLNRAARMKKVFSPLGLPLRSWAVFTRRHFGMFWFLYFFWPYFKIILLNK